MNIVIIEDERLIAEDLKDILQRVNPQIHILASIDSVADALDFFSANTEEIDLIFSDIHLGDGLSFEIFMEHTIEAPVIFCTAFDQYAIDAFKMNGIDYILKPFSVDIISNSLERYNNLSKAIIQSNVNISKVIDLVRSSTKEKNQTFLIHYKDKIIPIQIQNIALFYIRNDSTYIHTFDQESYVITKSLEELEATVGDNYFRANRQFLVHRNAIKDASSYINRKYLLNLQFPFREQITVSKEKMTSFLKWLSN